MNKKKPYQVGALIKKCVCREKKCVCGSYGPIITNPAAHKQFVKNMFKAIR